MIGYDPRISAQMADWKDRIPAGGIRVAGCDLCRMRNESRISKMRTKVSGRSRSPHRQDRVTRAQGCEQARAGERPAHGSAVQLTGEHRSESANMHSLKRCINQRVGSLIDRHRYVGSNPAASNSRYSSDLR